MPLNQGKSEQAFEQNVKTEVAAGKLEKQAVAIAYSVQRSKDHDPSSVLTELDIVNSRWRNP